jgi:phosphotransferase system enzyme I (PtsI)
MIPMISSLNEIRKVKEIFRQVKDQLTLENIKFSDNIPVGIMIEVPSAAICSDMLAKEVDFFSIGTNDLIQYTVAADRMNDKVADIYDIWNPAVLRLIKMTIENGHKAGISVGMCGSAAGSVDLIPIFLKMGLDEFSVSPRDVLKIRERISFFDRDDESIDINKILHFE